MVAAGGPAGPGSGYGWPVAWWTADGAKMTMTSRGLTLRNNHNKRGILFSSLPETPTCRELSGSCYLADGTHYREIWLNITPTMGIVAQDGFVCQ